MSLTEVRLRPAGPWRTGHRAGDRERVDVIYHSDALYSAVTHAMKSLGWLEDWLDATARAAGDPAVRFSSLFPFIGKTRLITPPRTVWPPVNAGKIYLQGAKLVPLELIRTGAFDESRWSADGATECLVPAGAGAPFHVSMRSAAAVDRITGATEPHSIACLEFASNAGWWGVFDATDKNWEGRVKSAFRLLADSGFGGERSRGWGRAGAPQFSDASGLFGNGERNGTWWLLSLYSPGETDVVDWLKGEYSTATRGGWTDSPAGAGAKKQVRMIEEGSVLSADQLRGRAVDVAPDGFAHPVYRSGFALAVRVPHVGQALPPVHVAEEAAVQPEEATVSETPEAPVTEKPAPQADEQPAISAPEEPVVPKEPEAPQYPAALETPEGLVSSRDREGVVIAPAPQDPAPQEDEQPAVPAPEEATVPAKPETAQEPFAPETHEDPIPNRDREGVDAEAPTTPEPEDPIRGEG
jgi:CRISPR/Cas system CSM-associated protein Csm4 (group 5 of RAMP superfamily)